MKLPISLKAGVPLALFASMIGVAQAAAILIDFDGVTPLSLVNHFYNGGTDSAGASGPNLGVDFSSSSFGVDGPEAAFLTNHVRLAGNGGLASVAAGFGTSLDFDYAALLVDSFVTIYDGVNGTGIVLASATLAATAFQSTSVSFTGIGRSFMIDASGNRSTFLLDNLRFGDVPTAAVPAPATWALVLLGFGVSLLSRR